MKTLTLCLGLVRASEAELADAFNALANRHHDDFEVREGCKLFARWSRARRHTLDSFIAHYGRMVNSDPGRLHSALFHGVRAGGYGLLRDLQDALLLTHQTRSAWTVVGQAAKEMRDTEMAEAATRYGSEMDREIDWLCTHIKILAPQALTVPPDLGDELKTALPKTPLPSGFPEMGWAPVAAGLAVLGTGAVSLMAGMPWLFPSLGPTAFLIGEMPEHPSSRVYNTVVGHLIGLAAGFLGVAMFHASVAPSVLTDHVLTAGRLGAAVVAIIITLLVGLLMKASHPPAAATTLLVASGALHTSRDATNLLLGALVMALLGVVIRKLRTKARAPKDTAKADVWPVLAPPKEKPA